MFNAPPLVPTDSNNEATIIHIIKSLRQLEDVTDGIFECARTRISCCRDRINSFNKRIQVLEQKVEVLRSSPTVPVLYCPSTYPTNGLDSEHEAVFKQVPSSTPYHLHILNDGIVQSSSDQQPSFAKIVKEAQLRKSRYNYIFKKPRFTEKNLEVEERPCNNNAFNRILLCNDETYTTNSSDSFKNSEASELLDSDSLLVHCEFDKNSVLDPFSYKPEVGNLSAFDFPDVLPHLPGGSREIAFNDAFFEPIGMSATSSNSHMKRSIAAEVDLLAQNSFYEPSNSNSRKPSNLISQMEDNNPLHNIFDGLSLQTTSTKLSSAETTFQDSHLTSSPLPPKLNADNSIKDLNFSDLSLHSTQKFNGPMDGAKVQLKTNEEPSPLPSSSLLQSSSIPPVPPAPPPPPPLPSSSLLKNDSPMVKLSNDITKGHADLMQAIRAAGGSKNARLKKISNVSDSSNRPTNSSIDSKIVETGDDLMTSLTKALEMRRRAFADLGISGKQTSKKLASFDNKSYNSGAKKVEVGDALLRLRQVIPISPSSNGVSSNPEDEGSDPEAWN